ncbi:chemotaxis-specific protein-glutamate methyltransferase CheB [Planktothrix sp. FACHB-1355]|uniref:chemotaxis-specific protein-glutamate methyltransferase CheB n=1 Tax=Planktothrix sp. FACHB-1355 TaxID=2692854 RepID=UPI00168AD9F4|nr:chemotaxis-specific protein-glutamate methyltransferase CheB [Planktothrix sp. FACHB-1355]MBD3561991.1 chemotaxis-specific protein-glutamate methyltransferase CheB [Planktothrix sp. FACHB-1355]
MDKKIIKILIVEDSPVVTLILKRIFGSSPEMEVVGTAQNGLEALELIPKVQPDVICTDLHMARMNGLEFTLEVMSKYPRPILVISASVQPEDTYNVFQLLDAGAVDVFPKPRAQSIQDYEMLKQELIAKIKVLSGVAVFTLRRRTKVVGLQIAGGAGEPKSPKSEEPSRDEKHERSHFLTQSSFRKTQNSANPSSLISHSKYQVIAIGASTGGPQALHTILGQLPSNLPVPVICIQHISEGFLQGLVDWLASECKLPVKIATMGDLPQPGTVYFPPERRHLELNSQGKFVYSASPPQSGHRPSVTVTFKSVAHFYGRSAVGVLLTGMGSDGADGMLAISQAGGMTIAQNEASCVVFGMPKEAIALGGAQHILPIGEIAPFLLNRVGGLGLGTRG